MSEIRVHLAVLAGLILSACTASQPPVTQTPVSRSGPAPMINSVTPAAGEVMAYGLFEVRVDLQAAYANPYDIRQVDLKAVFKGPDGREWKVPGFWDADKSWRIRFTPSKEGQWTYLVSVHDQGSDSQPWQGKFNVVRSDRHGWLQVASWVDPQASPRYLAYQDGTPFYGIGHCDAFGLMTSGFDADKASTLFAGMAAAGENMLVYWPVYSNPFFKSSYDLYTKAELHVLDVIVREAAQKGIFLIFTIWDHNEIRDKTHSWEYGLWEINNGFHNLGSINSFFTGAEAWAWQENLYRYMIARWGYSPAIGMWQTVSETDGTNAYAQTDKWHKKVNDYFARNDPYRHPTTASRSGDKWWPAAYQVMDIPQIHSYKAQNDPVGTGKLMANWTQRMWDAAERPNMVGEFGTDIDANNPEQLHNAIWAGLASGAAVTPLDWNDGVDWGSMSVDMLAQMSHLARFVSDLPLAKLNPERLRASVKGPGLMMWGIGREHWGILWVQDTTLTGHKIDQVRKSVVVRSGVQVTIKGLEVGTYRIRPYDPWAGSYLAEIEAAAGANGLIITLPDFRQDLALRIERK